MLDRSKLIFELQRIEHDLFVDDFMDNTIHEAWQSIVDDPDFLHKVMSITNAPWPLPLWQGQLDTVIAIEKITKPYQILSVDGSQIYPDRHAILSCFLINIGSIVLPYSLANKRVTSFSHPTVFAYADQDYLHSVDGVNCMRQELELRAGLEQAVQIKKGDATPFILLFDGSLIFWHLASKEPQVRDYFLCKYLTLLDQLYQEKIAVAWYISMPKSKELVNLVRLYVSDCDITNVHMPQSIDKAVDSIIMNKMLVPHTRSILFRNQSSISNQYPDHVRPYFFYVHTGSEIGRVEIPSWIAHDEQCNELVAQIVIDQCIKGNGYPVALAEAHEQAVVKGPDREFFYHFLQKMGIERKRAFTISRKSLKKRSIGV